MSTKWTFVRVVYYGFLGAISPLGRMSTLESVVQQRCGYDSPRSQARRALNKVFALEAKSR